MLKRWDKLLKRHENRAQENILFTDEIILTVEQHFNNKTDKAYAKTLGDDKKKLFQGDARPNSASVVTLVRVADLNFCGKVSPVTVLERPGELFNTTLLQ